MERIVKDKLNNLTNEQKLAVMNSEMAAMNPLDALSEINELVYLAVNDDYIDHSDTIKFLVNLSNTFLSIMTKSVDNEQKREDNIMRPYGNSL